MCKHSLQYCNFYNKLFSLTINYLNEIKTADGGAKYLTSQPDKTFTLCNKMCYLQQY